MKLEEIIENCIKYAIEYGVSSYEVVVDSRKTNTLHTKQYKNFKKLKKHPQGKESLYGLTKHSHIYVRYRAAIYLLSIDEKKAKEVILEAASSSKAIELDSYYLLQEWDNGNLKEYYN